MYKNRKESEQYSGLRWNTTIVSYGCSVRKRTQTSQGGVWECFLTHIWRNPSTCLAPTHLRQTTASSAGHHVLRVTSKPGCSELRNKNKEVQQSGLRQVDWSVCGNQGRVQRSHNYRAAASRKGIIWSLCQIQRGIVRPSFIWSFKDWGLVARFLTVRELLTLPNKVVEPPLSDFFKPRLDTSVTTTEAALLWPFSKEGRFRSPAHSAPFSNSIPNVWFHLST